MRYNFRKVLRVMDERGLHPGDISHMSKRAVDTETVRKALKRGTAWPATARVIADTLGIPMRDILPKRRSVA